MKRATDRALGWGILGFLLCLLIGSDLLMAFLVTVITAYLGTRRL